MSFKYNIGCYGKDTITGFKGVIIGRANFIASCNQYLVASKLKGGRFVEPEWIDEWRLKVSRAGQMIVVLPDSSASPLESNAKPKP